MTQPMEVYTGKVLKAGELEAAEPDSGRQISGTAGPASIADHMMAADSILEEIRSKAESLHEAKMAEIDEEFENRLANRLLAASKELNLGLEEISGDLVAILGTALVEILGDPKNPRTLIAAVKRNVRRYQQEKGLRVIVSPKDLEKLTPHWEKARDELQHVSLSSDETLSEGRCLLSVGSRRFEIGIEAQVKAFEAEAAKIVRHVLADEVA